MSLISKILKSYHLSDNQITELSEKSKRSSVGCGKGKSEYELTQEEWTLLYNISNTLWDDISLPIKDKVILGFELFDLFPSYFHTLVPYYHLIVNKELTDIQVKNLIWEKLMYYLMQEPCYSDPVGYVLWVDFFEDADTVNESWDGLLNCNNSGKIAIYKLLYSSGPVPYELKESVYKEFLQDTQSHEAIFHSILFSVADIYGKINKSKAKKILDRLKVNTKSENYKFLIGKLR